jgi:hypothetical protein
MTPWANIGVASAWPQPGSAPAAAPVEVPRQVTEQAVSGWLREAAARQDQERALHEQRAREQAEEQARRAAAEQQAYLVARTQRSAEQSHLLRRSLAYLVVGVSAGFTVFAVAAAVANAREAQ